MTTSSLAHTVQQRLLAIAEVESWVAEYGRLVAPQAFDALEEILHRRLCMPEHDCRCRQRKEV